MDVVTPINYNDIDFNEILEVESFFEENKYYQESMIPSLLDYFVFCIRYHILTGGEDIYSSSFWGCCDLAADIGRELTYRYGFKYFSFNIGDILSVNKVHKVFLVSIPLPNGFKMFLIDSTFKQLCKSSDAGSFLEASNHELYEQLLRNGYFEIGFSSLKIYLDAFKVVYGKNNVEISGEKYWRLIGENPDNTYRSSGMIIVSPLELLKWIKDEQSKMGL